MPATAVEIVTFDFGQGPVDVGNANFIIRDNEGVIEVLALALRVGEYVITLQSERGLHAQDHLFGPGEPSHGVRDVNIEFLFWDMNLTLHLDYRIGDRRGPLIPPPEGYPRQLSFFTMSNPHGAPFSLVRSDFGFDFETVLNANHAITPRTGDFDRNGVRDAADIDALTAATLDPFIDSRDDRYEYDVNRDGPVNELDRSFLVRDLMQATFGDANLDGRFDSSDLNAVLQAGKYRSAAVADATWATGDWNGDQEFDQRDLIFVFQQGEYVTE
jgi:hypothetical protein